MLSRRNHGWRFTRFIQVRQAGCQCIRRAAASVAPSPLVTLAPGPPGTPGPRPPGQRSISSLNISPPVIVPGSAFGWPVVSVIPALLTYVAATQAPCRKAASPNKCQEPMNLKVPDHSQCKWFLVVALGAVRSPPHSVMKSQPTQLRSSV